MMVAPVFPSVKWGNSHSFLRNLTGYLLWASADLGSGGAGQVQMLPF